MVPGEIPQINARGAVLRYLFCLARCDGGSVNIGTWVTARVMALSVTKVSDQIAARICYFETALPLFSIRN